MKTPWNWLSLLVLTICLFCQESSCDETTALNALNEASVVANGVNQDCLVAPIEALKTKINPGYTPGVGPITINTDVIDQIMSNLKVAWEYLEDEGETYWMEDMQRIFTLIPCPA